jgi:HSP20 family protein
MAVFPLELRRPFERLGERIQAALERMGSIRGNGVNGSMKELAPQQLARVVYRGPALDVEETDDAVIVRAELPGMQPEDFTVEATADRLTIRGEKRLEREHRGRSFYRLERRYGAFVRTVPLPSQVNPDRVEASYSDGVLTVTLPKTEAAKARRIDVRTDRSAQAVRTQHEAQASGRS